MTARYAVTNVAVGDEPCIHLKDNTAEVEATIAPRRGCELASLRYRGVELLYRGSDFSAPPAGTWGGKGPLLFPAVGRHRDGAYSVSGVSRPMSTHGFGRSLCFQVDGMKVDDDNGGQATFSVSAEDEGAAAGRDVFPFPWRLELQVSLQNGELRIVHTVSNVGTKGVSTPFPVALGNHITLNFPLLPSSSYEDAVDSWTRGSVHSCATHSCELTAGSLLSGVTLLRSEFTSTAGLPLTDPLATNGVLAELPDAPTPPATKSWILVSQPGKLAVRVWHSCSDRNVPLRFVLWGTPPPAPCGDGRGFICPEPWMTSGPDSLNGAPANGTPVLGTGEVVTWTMGVEVQEC